MILNFGTKYQEPKPCKVYINDDPCLTLTYFTERWRLNLYKVYINADPGLTMTVFEALCLYITIVFENLLQSPLTNQSEISCGVSFERGNKSLH